MMMILFLNNICEGENMLDLKRNLEEVKENIVSAAKRADRDPKDITLIAVSKTKPIEMLQTVYDQGIRDFGENKVQELCEKYEALPKDIRWHMIGHLQTNKVKQVIDKAYMIHGVDSLHLAEEISKQAVKKNITAKILLEVNIASEDSKFGLQYDDVIEEFCKVIMLPNIEVHGLMCIAPNVDNPDDNRQYFVKLCKLVVDINNYICNNSVNINNMFCELSMGMSNDYEVAVEEGATFVRVGTGIFGERDYTKHI